MEVVDNARSMRYWGMGWDCIGHVLSAGRTDRWGSTRSCGARGHSLDRITLWELKSRDMLLKEEQPDGVTYSVSTPIEGSQRRKARTYGLSGFAGTECNLSRRRLVYCAEQLTKTVGEDRVTNKGSEIQENREERRSCQDERPSRSAQ